MEKRSVFIVSDGTGLTAEALGHSLFTQFEGIEFDTTTLPFIDSVEKAAAAVAQINETATRDGVRALVFGTLVNGEVAATVRKANAMYFDVIGPFIEPLEKELRRKSTHVVGRSHTTGSKEYQARVDAINFCLSHDDGVAANELQSADVVLVGVSRSGKTPTSLYLALQFGIKAANHPLIPEDFERRTLPKMLHSLRGKLYGLTIRPERLHQIRNERRPNSNYASLDNCRYEVREAETMMRREGILSVDSTTKSIEEIAATIMRDARLERRVH